MYLLESFSLLLKIQEFYALSTRSYQDYLLLKLSDQWSKFIHIVLIKTSNHQFAIEEQVFLNS